MDRGGVFKPSGEIGQALSIKWSYRSAALDMDPPKHVVPAFHG